MVEFYCKTHLYHFQKFGLLAQMKIFCIKKDVISLILNMHNQIYTTVPFPTSGANRLFQLNPSNFQSPQVLRPSTQFAGSQENYQLQMYHSFIEHLKHGINLVLITSKRSREEVKCYLSEFSNSILYILKKNNQILMIDIGSSEIMDLNLKYEVGWYLDGLQYLVLQQNKHDFILLFNDLKQKQWFKTNLEIMKSRAGDKTIDDHQQFGKALSLFRKYSRAYKVGQGISSKDFSTILQLLDFRDIEKTKYILMILFSSRSFEIMNLQQFCNFLRLYYCKYGCYPLFQKYCKLAPRFEPHRPTLQLLTPLMTIDQFKKFLIMQQHESSQNSNKILEGVGDFTLSYYQFCRYIFSDENYAHNKNMSVQESDYPLNQYYCFSSHNTYLVGNQLTSKSKTRRYIQDLQNGYRCLQLDVHDSNQGPIIHHKLTLTSSIPFQDVVKAISKFSNSQKHTPIILSIQIHCKPQGRHDVASTLIKYFGNKILLVNKDWKEYPKLSSLWNRIIIKGHVAIEQMIFYPHPIVNLELLRSITGIYKSSQHEDFHACVTYISMSFRELQSNVRVDGSRIIDTTSKMWMRTYPNGTNFFSQNDNPILAMQMGIQMIAINSQKNDVWKLILQSYYQQKKDICSGYILKPDHLRLGSKVLSTPIKLSVQVISANNIRFPNNSNYYVKMAFYGSQEDNVFGNNFQLFLDVTEAVNGQEALFMNSVPIVYSIKQPYFAFILFEVPNYGNAAISVRSLRKGYRKIKLLNQNFKEIHHSSLLIRTQFFY